MGRYRVLTGVLLSLVLMVAAFSAAAEKPTEKREFLHFGNMGGLMPDLKASDLPDPSSQGAEYLQTFCNQCHNMPGPGMRTQEEWSRIYWVMYWRMHLMNSQYSNFLVPTYGQGKVLFAYLMNNAMNSVRLSLVRQDVEGAPDYSRTCMQCHQLPNPKQHTAAEWPAVVKRMKRHMRSMGKIVPSDEEAGRIVMYLSNAARP